MAIGKNAHLHYQQYTPVWPSCDLTDFTKLKVGNGRIYFSLYQQDGELMAMELPDTYMNRLYVSWFQIHDRYPPPFVHPMELSRWADDGGRA